MGHHNLTDSRVKFFKFIADLIRNDEMPDYVQFNGLMTESKIDIDVQYLSRNELPKEDANGKPIRPDIKQRNAAIPAIDQA